MAMLEWGWSKCSICGSVLAEGDDIVATTHFIEDESDPLWEFSDSGMHRRCYEEWKYRDEFTSRYRSAMAPLYPGSHYENWPE